MVTSAGMPGYARFRTKGVRGLVIDTCQDLIEGILEKETLYAYAARQPSARQYEGRTTAYGIDLGGGCGEVVVRHAMRGGALARTGTDVFMPPTRGLREVVNSLRLRLSGVATPEVVAFISYPAGPFLRRSDVATRLILDSHDLAVVLREMKGELDRESCLAATGRLLAAMSRAGAHHPDLNARNVLITWDASRGAAGHILDVDRIRFHIAGDPMVGDANIARLERSLKKLRDRNDIDISDSEISIVKTAAMRSTT